MLSSIEKRIEENKRQRDIAIQSFALIPKDMDTNKSIVYYRKEKERVEKAIDFENKSIDDSIESIRQKTEAAIKQIEEDTERKIEALERKRKQKLSVLESQQQTYSTEITTRIQKLEEAEPDTPAFRKIKAEETRLEKELKEAEEEYHKANMIQKAATERSFKNRIKEREEEHDRQRRQQLAIDQAERERIEEQQRRKQEEEQRKFDEASERAGKRTDNKQPEEQDYVKLAVDSLNNAFPERKGLIKYGKKGKQLKLEELNRNTIYTVLDLDTIVIDYDKDDESKIELWEELRTAAAKREKLPGWWVDK